MYQWPATPLRTQVVSNSVLCHLCHRFVLRAALLRVASWSYANYHIRTSRKGVRLVRPVWASYLVRELRQLFEAHS